MKILVSLDEPNKYIKINLKRMAILIIIKQQDCQHSPTEKFHRDMFWASISNSHFTDDRLKNI